MAFARASREALASPFASPMASPGSRAPLMPLVLLIAVAASSSAGRASQQPGAWRFWSLLRSSTSATDSSSTTGSPATTAPSGSSIDSGSARDSVSGGEAEGPGAGTSQRFFHGQCFSSAHEASRATLDLEGLSHLAESGQAPAQQLLERVRVASALASDVESGAAVEEGGRGGAGALLPQRSGKAVASAAEQEQRRRTCWEAAYMDLVVSCREILSNEARKTELALRLTNCFLETSGRDVITCPGTGSDVPSEPLQGKVSPGGKVPSGGGKLPSAGTNPESLKSCLASLTDHQHLVYLAYFVDCPSICHYLQ